MYRALAGENSFSATPGSCTKNVQMLEKKILVHHPIRIRMIGAKNNVQVYMRDAW